jgi:LmbE family N-acetylglucosaminyl deacetylase
MKELGTMLTVWAHPDEETYLVGGLAAVLIDAGQRVVCVTATRGEAGGNATDLAQVRTSELEAALKMVGVEEHHWLDYPDGGCAAVDPDEAAARIRAIVDEDYGVFELGRPRVCADREIDVLLPLDDSLLDRKVEALLLQ